jgi:hypothetical protein
MGKIVHDDVLDGALNIVKNNGTRLCVCSTQPTTYAEAITTYKLAIKTITGTDFTGPADGDTNGRKLTVNAANGLNVDTGGDAQHIAIADSGNSKLLYVTTCTLKTLAQNDSVNVPAWDIEIADPTP